MTTQTARGPLGRESNASPVHLLIVIVNKKDLTGAGSSSRTRKFVRPTTTIQREDDPERRCVGGFPIIDVRVGVLT
jgi:hypothetical protein